MDNFRLIHLPYTPPPPEVDYFINFPPFALGVKRGEGGVAIQSYLTFKDGIERPLLLSLSRTLTPVGYDVLVNFYGFDLLVFSLRDEIKPYYGSYQAVNHLKGEKI